MKTYCLKCKKDTENLDSKFSIHFQKIKGKSKYIIFLTERTFIDEIEGEIYL